MKNYLPLVLVFLFIFMLVSCVTHIPLAQTPSDNNRTYRVDYLFEHEGCKVYRFMDNGQYVYFTNCSGNTSVAKSDTTRVQIQNRIYRQE